MSLASAISSSSSTSSAIAIARDKLTRDLTDAECREYLHVDACPDP
ncbi:hypothetical protein BH23ACT10_BH23ACT10_06220 [soil metagenome]